MHFQRSSEDRQGRGSVIQWDLCQPRCEEAAGGSGREERPGRQDGRVRAGLLPGYSPKAPRRCGSSDLLICCKSTPSLPPAFAVRWVPSGNMNKLWVLLCDP